MKNAWTLLLILATCRGALKCNKNDNCICIPGQEFEFQCPRKFEDDGGFVIHIKENTRVQIDCTIDKFDETLLPNVTVQEIQGFYIRFCPLPKRSFHEILDRFSIQKLTLFQFGSSDLANITLTKDYFTGLDQLVNLRLNSNNILDLQDDVFSNTPNLTSLELQGNQIKLKRDLFQYTPYLKSLDLSENKLKSVPDGVFRDLPHLQILHLWNNNLTTLDEFTFEGLFNLTSLELSANKIENITGNTFYNLTNLTQINLSLNRIKTIPSNLFFNNKKLKLIRISRNLYELQLEDFLFSNLPELQHIDLTNCQINAIPENIFQNSTNLQQIALEGNNLQYLPQNLFKQLQNLEEVYLGNNKIEDISNVLASLKKLKKLVLRGNSIKEIGISAFRELDNLEEIDLSRNLITSIHFNAFANKENLKIINLSHNLYSKKKDISVILEGVTNVVNVDLSYNLITQIDDVIVLYNKVGLTHLDLSHNEITDISLKDLQPMSNKLFIKLENNNITTVDFRLTRLLALSGDRKDARSIFNNRQSVIDLSNNPLDCDCLNYDLFLYLKNEITPEVKVLYEIRLENLACANPPVLQNILVKDLSPSLLICSLEKLTNGYTGCPDECSCNWRPFDESVVIDCAKKNFTQFPEIYVTPSPMFPFNQTEMHLEENSLEMGPDSNLTGYDNVTRLYLSHNRIKDIAWLPPKVEVVHLDNNNLKALDYKFLDILNTSDVRLTLNNNPWQCDCEADNLTNFLRQHIRQIDTKNIFCFNSKTRLIDLNRNDLCHEWQNVYTALLVTLFLLLVAITVALYYRYQEEIKAWLWIHNCCLSCVGEEDLDKDKIYDAFISYSHKDEDLVTQNLIPVLEGGPKPYNLCLHGRNFIPGEFIAKQVITCVLESKRTIVILSPNFIESVWGLMEFRTAHTQAMTDGRARVIVVLYGDVDIDKLDPELKIYLKTNTYVKWGDPFFWNKLKYALPHRKRDKCANPPDISQKHANIMNGIDDKFKLVAPVTTSPGSTPPVLSLDATLLKNHPLSFVASPELGTPPAESGTLLTTTNT